MMVGMISVVMGAAILLVQSADKATIQAQGTVKYVGIEGGFYGIVSDDSGHYDPINLPLEFQTDGLRIRFAANIRYDRVSSHMWGKIIELISIEELT